MSEKDVVNKLDKPLTRQSLVEDFEQLGLKKGMTIIVHSSLSSLGWVCGGPVAVVQALMDIITIQGNIVMPTHSSGNSEPSHWQNPPVPQDWWPVIRKGMPAFDVNLTPTSYMGKIAEVFRTHPETNRSYHPACSFAAWGKDAKEICHNQPLDYPMGDNSPLAKVYDLNGMILLIGVGHDSNTSLHLAEHRSGTLPSLDQGGAIFDGSNRKWVTFKELDYDTECFPSLGKDFELNHKYLVKKVGNTDVKLFSQREIVDFSIDWIKNKHTS